MLKWIGILTMVIDHIAVYFDEWLSPTVYTLMRLVGRLSFPIFCYFLALGFRRTSNLLMYFVRLVGFAGMSQIFFEWGHRFIGMPSYGPNVLFTFATGLVFLSGYALMSKSWRDVLMRVQPVEGDSRGTGAYHVRVNFGGYTLDPKAGFALGVVMLVAAFVTTILYDLEYGLYGLFMIWAFYYVQDREAADRERKCYLVMSILHAVFYIGFLIAPSVFPYFSEIQIAALATIPIIYGLMPETKRQSKPNAARKYFFYVFYPLHLVALMLIRWLILN